MSTGAAAKAARCRGKPAWSGRSDGRRRMAGHGFGSSAVKLTAELGHGKAGLCGGIVEMKMVATGDFELDLQLLWKWVFGIWSRCDATGKVTNCMIVEEDEDRLKRRWKAGMEMVVGDPRRGSEVSCKTK
ncbi:hypothetical protein M0R45_020611 [Rubus argutus]|uniref:Uncharacterized protein n=1 Tax=Rubus argutus TaxID=59490 RepID=A0AAW1X8W4_RUBAR